MRQKGSADFLKDLFSISNSPHLSAPSLSIHKVFHGAVMEGITTWHVTLKCRCAGTRGRWTSTPGTTRNSTRRSTSASPPTCMAPRTPTRSDCACTVRSDMEAGGEAGVCAGPALMHRSRTVTSVSPQRLHQLEFNLVQIKFAFPFHYTASNLCACVGAPVWPREIIEPVVISAGLPLVLSCDPPPGPPKPETYWMSSCECVSQPESEVAPSRRKHTCVLSQARTPDLSTGLSRRLSPPCSQCGRTAGCPWVSTETCTSPMSTSTTLRPITAATLACPTGTSFSRRCPWLLKFSPVGVVVCGCPDVLAA